MNILDQSPNGEDGYRKGDGSSEKVGELRKWEVDESIVEGGNECFPRCVGRDREKLRARGRWNERGILKEVTQNPEVRTLLLWQTMEEAG